MVEWWSHLIIQARNGSSPATHTCHFCHLRCNSFWWRAEKNNLVPSRNDQSWGASTPTLLTCFRHLGNSHKENISSQLSSAQCGVCRSTRSTKVHEVTARYSSGWINVHWLYWGASSDFSFVFFSFLYYLLQEFQLLTLAFQTPTGKFSWLEGFWRNRQLHSHSKNLPLTLQGCLLHPTNLRRAELTKGHC